MKLKASVLHIKLTFFMVNKRKYLLIVFTKAVRA